MQEHTLRHWNVLRIITAIQNEQMKVTQIKIPNETIEEARLRDNQNFQTFFEVNVMFVSDEH